MIIKGFSFSAVAAGIKYPDRLDLGLIYSDEPAVTAGVFTTNQVKAAPVLIDIERLRQGRSRAILVNSGCANACTGRNGTKDALASGRLAAEELGIDEEMVLLSSTGVIGMPLNLPAFQAHMKPLVNGLGPDNFENVAQAIMTTDTVPKTVYRSEVIGGKEIGFMGMAKGAGMIMPNMATLLCFIVTDARISYFELNQALKSGVAESFNRITIDGDTSTNDMVLVMANGAAGNDWIDDVTRDDYTIFQNVLDSMLKELAMKVVQDAEGATKCVTIRVCGAKENREAEIIARTIATSSLVKTAFFGEDANWGRIIAAMGRSGVRFNPDHVDIAFGEVVLVRNGVGLGPDAERAATEVLRGSSFTVCIDLKDGSGCEEVLTCDFSIDYVKINADYRT